MSKSASSFEVEEDPGGEVVEGVVVSVVPVAVVVVDEVDEESGAKPWPSLPPELELEDPLSPMMEHGRPDELASVGTGRMLKSADLLVVGSRSG
jgi:hypothetical protein